MNAKRGSIMVIMLMLSMLITPRSLLAVNSTDQRTTEKRNDVSAQHHPPRTVWVRNTHLLTTGKERPPNKWDYFEKLEQPTTQLFKSPLKYLPPPGPT